MSAARPLPAVRTADLVVPVLRFRNRSIRRGERWDLPLGEFLGQRHAVRDELRGAPSFSFGVTEFGSTERRYSAVVLPFHLESDPAFLQTGFLHDRAFVLYTAFDHRVDGDASYRYRLILPLSRPVNGHDYRVVARAFDSELGGLADWSQERRDRRWAMPACPPERYHLATLRYGDGPVLDVDELLGTRVSVGLRRLV